MPQCTELGTFELAASRAGLLLSASSHFFTTDAAAPQPTSQSMLSQVQAGELRFLPPRALHVHIIVRFDDCSMNDVPEDSKILEFMAGAICLSSLWDRLGLTTRCTKALYHTDTEESPNLLLEVEHSDKSSSLLAPPGVKTSTFEGLICEFNYHSTANYSDTDEETSSEAVNVCGLRDMHEWERHMAGDLPRLEVEHDMPGVGAMEDTEVLETAITPEEIRYRRQSTADLAVASLHKMIGVRAGFPGIRVDSPPFPSLLELAPTVWSAHYMQATAEHSRTLPVIAGSIAEASRWRPSVTQKLLKLSGQQTGEIDSTFGQQPRVLRDSIQRRLWSIVDSSLPVTVGMRSAMQHVDRQSKQTVMGELEAYLFPDQTPRSPGEETPRPGSAGFSCDEGQYMNFPM